jgi:glycosyltransferase involved in cell wall biosynthesis
MIRIDQLMAGVADGDATSHAALAIRDALRDLGFASDLFALPQTIDPSIRSDIRDAREYRGTTSDILIHHYGWWSEAAGIFKQSSAQKILIYHNVTPPDYFYGFHDDMARNARKSLDELPGLLDLCRRVWAVSEFNARDLRAMDAGQVDVLPLPFLKSSMDRPADAAILTSLRQPMTTILCVGRVAPNKHIEDLMEAFAWYHQRFNAFSRLLIVGSAQSCPKYLAFLRLLARDLQTPNICFQGFASPSGLVAYYELADVLVSTSAHEGYCLPLIEAMYKGVPVICRSAGGTPEALENSGVLYDELSARELAGLIHLVVTDASVRREILASQSRRLESIMSRDIKKEVHELLNGLI